MKDSIRKALVLISLVLPCTMLCCVAYADDALLAERVASQAEPAVLAGEDGGHVHQWSNWIVTWFATCVSEGEKFRHCTICGESESAAVPATGDHDWTLWTVDDYADCTSDGSESRKCFVCGKEDVKAIPAKGHDWESWETLRKATKFRDGAKSRSCFRCDAEQMAAIPRKEMTRADEEALASAEAFFLKWKKYDYKGMKRLYVSKTRDFAVGDFEKPYRKQFSKKLSYTVLDISSGKSNASVRVKIVSPYAKTKYYRAYESWYDWYVSRGGNVSNAISSSYLTKKVIACTKSMPKKTRTITLKMKKQYGTWKIVGTSVLRDVLDCGLRKAESEFKSDYF